MRRQRLIFPLIIFTFVMVFVFSFFSTRDMKVSNAAEGFNPGLIITDYVMSEYNSMTEAEIQTFLKSKNSCDNTNTYLATVYSSYSYHIKDGHFVCLADELFGEGIEYGGTTGETAAHIKFLLASGSRLSH